MILSGPWQRDRLRFKQPEDCSAMYQLSEKCPPEDKPPGKATSTPAHCLHSGCGEGVRASPAVKRVLGWEFPAAELL